MVTLLISSGNGPGECQQAVGHVLTRLRDEAEARGVTLDLAGRAGRDGPVSAIAVLAGPGAEALAARWEGVLLWRCPSALRPRYKRKNWFVQVFRLPAAARGADIDPRAVEMSAIRAGGPGGQHQNKTSSAIRARWGATWWSCAINARSIRTGGWRWNGCRRWPMRMPPRPRPRARARHIGCITSCSGGIRRASSRGRGSTSGEASRQAGPRVSLG